MSRGAPPSRATGLPAGRPPCQSSHSRPGSRVWISWSSQPLPSGSLNDAYVKYERASIDVDSAADQIVPGGIDVLDREDWRSRWPQLPRCEIAAASSESGCAGHPGAATVLARTWFVTIRTRPGPGHSATGLANVVTTEEIGEVALFAALDSSEREQISR